MSGEDRGYADATSDGEHPPQESDGLQYRNRKGVRQKPQQQQQKCECLGPSLFARSVSLGERADAASRESEARGIWQPQAGGPGHCESLQPCVGTCPTKTLRERASLCGYVLPRPTLTRRRSRCTLQGNSSTLITGSETSEIHFARTLWSSCMHPVFGCLRMSSDPPAKPPKHFQNQQNFKKNI